jgi:mono/diheme cytochrome c family protein
VAEVPEHLLQRSAARRAALSGGAAPEAASSAPATTGDSAPATASAPAAAPAKVTPTEPAFREPVDKVAFQKVAAIKKRRIPVWAMGVLAALPLWGLLYVGAFGERQTEDVVVDGATIYGNNCAACHGANGQGGVGPKLAGGEVVKTFPVEDDHISWVNTGSAPFKGKGYGDPNREGGQHIAASGGMPGFQGKLTDEEIAAVVTYEREGL